MPGESDILRGAFNLPPEDAIKYFEQKGYRISFDWHEMKREAHTRAFTVAGVTQLDILVDIRKVVDDAQKSGKSLESFKKELRPLLQKKGWWGKKNITRPDGSQKEVNLSAPWRLKTMYQTNMRAAAMAGHYKGMKESADLMPYWRYVAVMDGRTRDEHRRLHGKILRHDDPFWNRYYPPNGWGCRCTVASMTASQVKNRGIKISDGEAMQMQIGPTVPDGWDYNPGLKAWEPDPKDYPAWAKEKVETIVENAREQGQKVSYIDKVDYSDKKRVLQTLNKQEKAISGQEFESAVVITKSGDIFRVDGGKAGVKPDILGNGLKGASVTHNHPASETSNTFSPPDLMLFSDYELEILRGIDDNFIYELNRVKGKIDDLDLLETVTVSQLEANPKLVNHLEIVRQAHKNGLGYRRYSR